jgi:hypothetical protein
MSEEFNPESPSGAQTESNLRQLAALLRNADHLDTATQKSLAALLDEIGAELESGDMTSGKTAQLAEAVTEVARSLHAQVPTEEIVEARDALKEAAGKAEVEAPVATGLAYRFIDLLSSIGI